MFIVKRGLLGRSEGNLDTRNWARRPPSSPYLSISTLLSLLAHVLELWRECIETMFSEMIRFLGETGNQFELRGAV
jgi:hypothetical protein